MRRSPPLTALLPSPLPNPRGEAFSALLLRNHNYPTAAPGSCNALAQQQTAAWRKAARSFARRRNRCPVLVAPTCITGSTLNGRRRGELLSYWNSLVGWLPSFTQGRCSRLARQGGNKQHNDSSQNCPSHNSLRGFAVLEAVYNITVGYHSKPWPTFSPSIEVTDL